MANRRTERFTYQDSLVYWNISFVHLPETLQLLASPGHSHLPAIFSEFNTSVCFYNHRRQNLKWLSKIYSGGYFLLYLLIIGYPWLEQKSILSLFRCGATGPTNNLSLLRFDITLYHCVSKTERKQVQALQHEPALNWTANRQSHTEEPRWGTESPVFTSGVVIHLGQGQESAEVREDWQKLLNIIFQTSHCYYWIVMN